MSLKNRSISSMFNDLLSDMITYSYIPTKHLGKTKTESGVDENGYNWYKTTFTSNDGSYTQVSSYKSTEDIKKMPEFLNTGNSWFEDILNRLNTMDEFNTQRKDVKSTKAGKAYSDRINILKNELEEAVKNQKFEEAIKLRDEIKTSEDTKSELETLKAELETLIEKHDFEKAIEVRDLIKQIEGK